MYKLSEIGQQYKSKLISLDAAAAKVKSGDRIYMGFGAGVAKDLDAALAKRINDLKDLEFVSTVGFMDGPFKCFEASKGNDSIRFASGHFSGFDRKMADDGRCWYIPLQFRELPSYWALEGNGFDVAMIQVAPMDAFGNFNLGPQVADIVSAVKHSKMVIVEVNENMPVAFGLQTELNIADVDFIVEGTNQPLTVVPTKAPSETDKLISSKVVELIESGSTLQLGIGALPTCIGSMLCESDVKDLSCHSEMLVDSYYDLYKAGKLTGNKNVMKGKMVYTFAGGARELYEMIDKNQILCGAPVDFVNDIEVVSQMDKFVSINSCLGVDLFGQVSSETIGAKHFSGTGGQLDFVLGAYKSKGGKSFICTPSTRKLKDGRVISTITPTLVPGCIVSTPRMAAHYIVTEYGAVNLKGKTTRQRAELIISIAHPDFREELIKSAEKLGIWKTTSKFTGL